jgi:hypothetical protein
MFDQVPRYVSPKQAAEERARRRALLFRSLFWIAVLLPLAAMLMAYGYSDQAPASLREFTIAVDGMLGQPVWTILKQIATPKG